MKDAGRTSAPIVLAALALLAACGPPTAAAAAREDAPPWAAPPLADAVVVRDGRTGEPVGLERFLDRLAEVDAVFLGETHTDEATHRVELFVYEGLARRRGEDVVLALEVFERDVQPALDAYLAGEIDEAAFLADARPWSNYRTAYRPMVELARERGLPVVASNFPRPLRTRMMTEGNEVLDSLEEGARRDAPAQLLPNTPAYWRRVDNAVRGHIGMMGGPKAPDDPRLFDTQSLWDNAMGEACADVLDANEDALVLHVNGGFHSAYWDGTVHQLLLRRPDAEVLTVAITPVPNPSVAAPGGAPRADFVVYAEARANDLREGTWSVWTSRELRYRFHLPESASGGAPVPLLVWLGADGLTAEDGLDLWRGRLGDEAAIAVLEPPYRERGVDLGESGRWFWADTFPEDTGVVIQAVERTWAYLLRHFPLDPGRVVLAGEGTGATMVAATTLLTDRIETRSVALSPRHYAKIKDFPLPLPELAGSDPVPERHLVVVGEADDREWWSGELDEYAAIGLPNELRAASDDPWTLVAETENALREALGLAPRPAPAAGGRRYVVVEGDTPRARHWARLFALREAENGEVVAVVDGAPPADATRLDTGVRAADYASGARALPRCPGPFGGSTVVVLPAGATPDELAAWTALEEDDPLRRTSRFHRLRVATREGERALPAVLTELREANRKNVLVVPAEFCADGATMRALSRLAREHEDAMTLHWLPGLGGGD